MTTRPVTFPGGQYLFGGGLAGRRRRSPCGVVVDDRDGSHLAGWLLALLALVSLLVGVLFVLPVGGADVPIVISLLNAFTGLTVAASGYVLDNMLLLVAGTLVGASGTILTRLMAAAMGRSLAVDPVRRVPAPRPRSRPARGEDRPVRSGQPEDVAILLGYARKVVIVPGYGLAVAQAQHTIRELAELLEARGDRGGLRHPPGRRPDARAHERAARRGERAVRGAQGDGRGQPGVRHHRRRAGRRRQRRGQPGRQDHAGRADLRHADPRGRPGPAGGVPQALDAARASPASRTSCSTTRRRRCSSATPRTR